jgi:nitrogen fixation NifU-like protein
MSTSGLEDLYREIILDHYRNPRNRGSIDVPPSQRIEAYNPLCGDEVVVYLLENNGILEDVRIEGQGCSISQSSASLMSAAVKGKTIEEVKSIISDFKKLMSIHESKLEDSPDDAQMDIDTDAMGELAALQGVVRFPVRIKCAILAWNALAQGLDEISADSSGTSK